jgi:hypothetical protein
VEVIGFILKAYLRRFIVSVCFMMICSSKMELQDTASGANGGQGGLFKPGLWQYQQYIGKYIYLAVHIYISNSCPRQRR